MSDYQPGIPTGLVDLDLDYVNIQNNFGQLDTTFGGDHVPFSQTENNSYHTNIHFVPPSTVTSPDTNYPPVLPSATEGFGILTCPQINDGYSTDTALYYITGAASPKTIQMTSNITPANTKNGYTFLPGGIIFQWGRVTGLAGAWPIGAQALVYTSQTGGSNISFAINTFNVQITFLSLTNSNSTANIMVFNGASLTNTGFTWYFNGSDIASLDGFFWTAIGI